MADSAEKLARRVDELTRRIADLERAGQFSRSTIDVEGSPVSVPDAIGQGVAAGATATQASAVAAAAHASADAASTTADAAQVAADEAQSAADSAAAAASDANAQALSAAGEAAGKGQVFYQASAPTGSRQSSANLWIRSSDNAPFTWSDSSSSWVQVTDQAATDAAAAAGDAQAVASSAQTSANQALSQAQTAQTTADGKNRITFSTADPEAAGTTDGDMYWKMSGNLAIGQWRWDGSEWQSQTLDGAVLANVTAAKIVAGAIDGQTITGATIRSATAGKKRVEVLGTQIDVYDAGSASPSGRIQADSGSGVIAIGKPGGNQVLIGDTSIGSSPVFQLSAPAMNTGQMFASVIRSANQFGTAIDLSGNPADWSVNVGTVKAVTFQSSAGRTLIDSSFGLLFQVLGNPGAQSLGAAGWVQMLGCLGGAVTNDGGYTWTGTGTGVLTVPAAGRYFIDVVCSLVNDNRQNRAIEILKNSTTIDGSGVVAKKESSGISGNVTTVLSLAAGDQLRFYFNSSVAGSISTNPADTYVRVYRLGS